MTDNQVWTIEGNDDDIHIRNDQNNILEHLDQHDPSIATIADHNSTDLDYITELSDLTVLP